MVEVNRNMLSLFRIPPLFRGRSVVYPRVFANFDALVPGSLNQRAVETKLCGVNSALE